MFVLRNSSWKSCSFDPLSNTDHSAKENCIPINWSKEDQWCFEPCYGILHDATSSTNCAQVPNGCAQARLPWHMRHAFCKFVNHFAGSTALEKPYYRWLETVFHCFAQMFTAFNEHKAGPMPENVVCACETWYMQYRVHYNRTLVACLSGRTLNILS